MKSHILRARGASGIPLGEAYGVVYVIHARPLTEKERVASFVTVERTLLKRADRLAKTRGVTRARLIEMGLRALLEAAESKAAPRVRGA